MMDCRVTLAWANHCEGEIVAVAVPDLIWTVGAFGDVLVPVKDIM